MNEQFIPAQVGLPHRYHRREVLSESRMWEIHQSWFALTGSVTLRSQGNLQVALESFRLAKSEPGNGGWRHDLSASQPIIAFTCSNAQPLDAAQHNESIHRLHSLPCGQHHERIDVQLF
jgi:hypothetical protein